MAPLPRHEHRKRKETPVDREMFERVCGGRTLWELAQEFEPSAQTRAF